VGEGPEFYEISVKISQSMSKKAKAPLQRAEDGLSGFPTSIL